MLNRTAEIIDIKEATTLYNKGHHTGLEMKTAIIAANKYTYKKRQAIVEHPYCTIKRQCVFTTL